MNHSQHPPSVPKRYDLWIGIVVGITLGLIGGVYFGRSFSPEPMHASSVRNVETTSTPDAGGGAGSGGEITTRKWISRYESAAEKAPANEATPGLAEIFGDALKPEEPFALARVLMLIEMMRKEDFPVAFEVLRKAKTSLHKKAVELDSPPVWNAFWQRFGERDPAKALAIALEPSDQRPEDRQIFVKQLFQGMARNSPVAAVEAYMAHPELPNRATAAEGMVFEWAASEPKAASEWIGKNLDGADRKKAYYALTWAIAGQTEIERANEFLKTLPEGQDRASALNSIRGQIRFKRFVPAQQILDFLDTTRSVGPRDRQFEAEMAMRCLEGDGFATANFFSQPLPDGSVNDFAELKLVASRWVRKDVKLAESWLKGQEGTPHYEVVATEFVNAAQERGDEAGKQRWLDTIEAHRNKNQPK